jgi:hypothetical protein
LWPDADLSTLDYAVKELQKDIQEQLSKLDADARAAVPKTELAVFVVINKEKEFVNFSVPSHLTQLRAGNRAAYQKRCTISSARQSQTCMWSFAWRVAA